MRSPILCKTKIICSPIRVMLAQLIVLTAGSASFAQTASVLNNSWSGQAQCALDVQGPGYTEHEVHTWTMSGGAPTVKGAMHIFAGTWSATGQGSYQRSQGNQINQIQWTMNAAIPNAPIAIFVRASDRRIIIKSWHAQLRSPGGITGTQQVTVNGVPQTPGKINLEAFEWQFPASGTAIISSPSIVPHFSGSKVAATHGAVGPMQPGGSEGTEQCNWEFDAEARAALTSLQVLPAERSSQ